MPCFWPSFWRAETGHSWLLQRIGLGGEPNRIIGGILCHRNCGLCSDVTGFGGWLVPEACGLVFPPGRLMKGGE